MTLDTADPALGQSYRLGRTALPALAALWHRMNGPNRNRGCAHGEDHHRCDWNFNADLAKMKHFIFNLVDGDRKQAASFLDAKRWMVGREERHRAALASGDLVLVFVAVTSEFVGRARLETAFLDPIPADPAAAGPAVSGVLLADADAWASGVPLAVAVQRIDPMGSNPYVQANAAGFRSGVVQITADEYAKVLSLHDEACSA